MSYLYFSLLLKDVTLLNEVAPTGHVINGNCLINYQFIEK